MPIRILLLIAIVLGLGWYFASSPTAKPQDNPSLARCSEVAASGSLTDPGLTVHPQAQPRFIWRSWGCQLHEASPRASYGHGQYSTRPMDQASPYDYTGLKRYAPSTEGLCIEQWKGEKIDTQELARDFAEVRRQIKADWGQRLQREVKVVCYASLEEKALRTQRMEVAHYTPENGEVHLVQNRFFQGMDWGEQYRPLLREALGEAAFDALEMGLALHYRRHIQGQDWRSWARQLASIDALVAPSKLTQQGWQDYYPLLGLISAASWVEYLYETLDPQAFIQYYRQGDQHAALGQQQAAWSRWVLDHYPRAGARPRRLPTVRLNGFTLAHEGYRIFNGYGGSLTDASLEHLRQLGTNAVAIVPYSYLRHPRRVSRIPVMRSAHTENDAATVHAHYEAQARGQFTLLKPQLWINGAWPGEVDFDTDQEWAAFFQYYRDWALHYAQLAEIYGFDAYCIGTELRHTTLKQPDRWRALIRDVRQIYQGTLTYAANWGEECEKLTFWSELDYIGVNNYYPLHPDSTATDAELLAGAQAIMDRLRHLSQINGRPLWLTELGYRSATTPWIQPHAEAGPRAIDEQAQARCYEALLSAMEPEREWLHGMFWWKWPCHLDHNESDGRGYMPLGKPAATVVKKYFY